MFLDLINKKKKIEEKTNMQRLFYLLESLIGTLLGILFAGGIWLYYLYSTDVKVFLNLIHPWYYYLTVFAGVILFITIDVFIYLINIKKKYNLKY